MNIRRGEVAEVASFYSYLRLPADVVRVCTGPVCDCLGGRALLEQNPGAVEVPCIGHCDLAPAMMRGDEVVPAVTHAANHGPSIDLLGDRTSRATRPRSIPTGSWPSSRRPGSSATAAPGSRPSGSGRRCATTPARGS